MTRRLDFTSVTAAITAAFVNALELDAVDLPTELSQRTGEWKGSPVQLRAAAWRGGPIASFRVVRVEGSSIDIVNVLAIPAPAAGVEIFGADLVRARLDTALVVADISPLRRDATVNPALPGEAAPALPEWAAAVFSAEPLVARTTIEDAPAVLHQAVALAQRFVRSLAARPAVPLTSEQYRAGIDRYMRAHLDDHRTQTMLGHMFGVEWSDAFVHSVLYPTSPMVQDAL